MAVPNDKVVLTAQEAAELLDISVNTFYDWTHIAGFPAVKIGNIIRIHRDQLMEWFMDQAGKAVIE